MRGNYEPGGSATPGASAGQRDEARPFSGSCTIFVVDHLSEAGRPAAQERRVGGDRHLLAYVADGEREVEPDFLARAEDDAFLADWLEPGQLDVDPILAWGELGSV